MKEMEKPANGHGVVKNDIDNAKTDCCGNPFMVKDKDRNASEFNPRGSAMSTKHEEPEEKNETIKEVYTHNFSISSSRFGCTDHLSAIPYINFIIFDGICRRSEFPGYHAFEAEL